MSDTLTSAHESPLSLRRLTNAFAAMLGRKAQPGGSDGAESPKREVPTNTRTITEALLFVGRPDNQPLSAEALAATMRDVTAAEVVDAITQLNDEYAADESALVIVESAAGYRLVLREELSRVRDKFYGKVQQATLNPAAMEVLSVIAYRQPVDLKTIDGLRGQKSQSLASSLVRRGLVRLERPADRPKQPYYVTTDRFLKVFQLATIEQLPQAQEFEAA
jgi:segregation and condensation protein B